MSSGNVYVGIEDTPGINDLNLVENSKTSIPESHAKIRIFQIATYVASSILLCKEALVISGLYLCICNEC